MGKTRNQTNEISAAMQLRLELQSTNQALRHAYDKFNFACEPELVDACVYEISSLKARYDYLLRKLKELSGHSPAVRPAAAAQPASPTPPEDLVTCVAAAILKGGPACPS
ncbi:MAG: DUF2508 family protein [Ruminococcaceae bacterium]|nr:DUF2508 family protein [Oscillospiraceae bacterium]